MGLCFKCEAPHPPCQAAEDRAQVSSLHPPRLAGGYLRPDPRTESSGLYCLPHLSVQAAPLAACAAAKPPDITCGTESLDAASTSYFSDSSTSRYLFSHRTENAGTLTVLRRINP